MSQNDWKIKPSLRTLGIIESYCKYPESPERKWSLLKRPVLSDQFELLPIILNFPQETSIPQLFRPMPLQPGEDGGDNWELEISEGHLKQFDRIGILKAKLAISLELLVSHEEFQLFKITSNKFPTFLY